MSEHPNIQVARRGYEAFSRGEIDDHGITPYPEETNGWAIRGDEVTADIQAEFDETPDDSPVVRVNRGYQLFLDEKEMERNGVSAEDISAFLRDYRLEDNVTSSDQLEGFEGRERERLFITALTPPELKRATACARERGER